MEHGEFILYQPDETVRLEVRVENETVWLNRQQLANLFGRDIKTIGKHINNALAEELDESPVVAKFATTAADGKVYQIEHYNLDMILSVGYRVKSKRGVEFRRWANPVLKDYMLKGYAINQRMERLENKVEGKLATHERKLDELTNKVDFIISSSLPPVEGIFFGGQVFDAYVFAASLVRSAKSSLILIDNYVDESVLLLLSKRAPGVVATIYTGKISPQLVLDLTQHNVQYDPVEIREYRQSHDRFLIVDNSDVYHIGASLKDLGKKLFAFSKLSIPADVLINLL